MPFAGPTVTNPDDSPDVQRVLMDRARRHAERDQVRAERPLAPRLVGLMIAVIVMLVLFFAFDRFLASMQRFMGLPVTDPEPAATEPMPAYVVPPAEDAAPAEPVR